MIRRPTLLLALVLPSFGIAQAILQPGGESGQQPGSITLPVGTPFPVEVADHLPMRVGTPVRAHLLYPVYAGSTLLLPDQTTVLGSIVALRPDHTRRVHARLNADFTPFYTPVVRFTQILLANGAALPISSGDAANGAPIFRIVAPPPAKGGFIRQQIDTAMTAAKDQVRVFTDPGKGDRLQQLLYHQLPYHPQRIEKGTAWTVETTQPLDVAGAVLPPSATAAPKPNTTDNPPTWIVQAYLDQALSSVSARVGDTIKATVAEPIFNADHTLAVPQGAVLVGAVTKAKPARRLGRAGVLSFSFRQLILPGEEAQSVQASLTGADSPSSAELAMNSEGEVKPRPRDKLVIPFILLSLAASPLDHDGGDGMIRKNALASNSLGIIGFVVGTAAQQPNLAAGLGYYGAALSIYDRVIARGKEVTFARDTRIVLQTTARRSTPMKSDTTAPRSR